jgi:hypothetical protein
MWVREGEKKENREEEGRAIGRRKVEPRVRKVKYSTAGAAYGAAYCLQVVQKHPKG